MLRRGDLLYRTNRRMTPSLGWNETIDFVEVVHTDPVLGIPWTVSRKRHVIREPRGGKCLVTYGKRVGLPLPLGPVSRWSRCGTRTVFAERKVFHQIITHAV